MIGTSCENVDYVIFSGSSNDDLAKKIADELGTVLAKSEVGKFSDGETYVRVDDMVRGKDVFIIQPTSFPANDTIMELLIMIDALKRASAGRITAVIPYYGYARQDRKARARDPITARVVADLLEKTGCNRILTMDLHCAQIQGFFTIPVDHMIGNPLLIQYYEEKFRDDKEDLIVVAPDIGSVKRSRGFAQMLDIPMAIIDKRRPEANVSEVMNIIGDVSGKRCIIVDDMIDTAGTICNAANALREEGATEIYACCTHPVLSGPAIPRIEKSAITELVVMDTLHLPEEKKIDKIKQLTVSKLLAGAIKRIHTNESVSELFK